MISKSKVKISISFLFAFTLLFSYVNWYGVKLTPDSYYYINASNSFTIEYLLNTYIHWPPLFPLALSICKEHTQEWTLLLNFFALFFSIVIWFYLGRKWITKDNRYLLYTFTIVFCTPIFAVSHFVWSEALFILLYSFFILAMYKIVYSNNNTWTYTLILSGILLCYQRHVGIVMIGGFIFGVILSNQIRKKLLLTLLITLSLGSSWLFIQIINGDNIQVQEVIPFLDLWRNFVLISGEITNWFLPFFHFKVISIIIFILLLFFIFRYKSKLNNKLNYVNIMIFNIIVYLAFFTVVPASPDDISRFLSILYYPIIFVLFVIFPNDLHSLNKYKNIVYIVLVLFIVYKVVRVIKNTIIWHSV